MTSRYTGLPLGDEEHAVRLALYDAGLTDREIGERLSRDNSGIGRWRRRHGLPTHGRTTGHTAQQRVCDSIKAACRAGASWRGACAAANLTTTEGVALYATLGRLVPAGADHDDS